MCRASDFCLTESTYEVLQVSLKRDDAKNVGRSEVGSHGDKLSEWGTRLLTASEGQAPAEWIFSASPWRRHTPDNDTQTIICSLSWFLWDQHYCPGVLCREAWVPNGLPALVPIEPLSVRLCRSLTHFKFKPNQTGGQRR